MCKPFFELCKHCFIQYNCVMTLWCIYESCSNVIFLSSFIHLEVFGNEMIKKKKKQRSYWSPEGMKWSPVLADFADLFSHYLSLQISVASCDGKCPSATIYNINVESHLRFCKCCRENGVRNVTVPLHCSGNGTEVMYTLQEPIDCTCQWNWVLAFEGGCTTVTCQAASSFITVI